jgi:hypothetical protein
MTEQIVIKLNKERFEPVLEALANFEQGTSRTYSEITGKCLVFLLMYTLEDRPELGGKTRAQFTVEKEGRTYNEGLLEFLQKYTQFIKEGKLDCLTKFEEKRKKMKMGISGNQ